MTKRDGRLSQGYERVEVERDRLRSALHRIARESDYGWGGIVARIQGIAREALEPRDADNPAFVEACENADRTEAMAQAMQKGRKP